MKIRTYRWNPYQDLLSPVASTENFDRVEITDNEGKAYYLMAENPEKDLENVIEFFDAHVWGLTRQSFSPILVGSADPLRYSMPNPLEVGGVWVDNGISEFFVLDTSKIQYFIKA